LFYADGDLVVTLDGVTQTLTTHYTVTGAGVEAGGTVTFVTAPETDASIIIQRIVDYTQETDFENFDGNPADVTEKQFDLLAMQTQQLAEQTDRAILAPITTSLTSNVITGTIDTTSRVLVITTSGVASSTLSSLTTNIDTIFSGLAEDDLLKYNGSEWENATFAEVVDINSLTTMSAAPAATTDFIPIYDASAGTNLKITPSDLFKSINTITAETSPVGTADLLVVYDASASAAKSMTINNALKSVNDLTTDSTPDKYSDYLLSYDASANEAKKIKPIIYGDVFHLADEKASGTAGGSSVATTWTKHDLASKSNGITGASVASSVVSLPAGTYRATGYALAYQPTGFKIRLRNTTDGSTIAVGSNGYSSASNNDNVHSHIINHIFTLAGTKNIELQYYAGAAVATNGLGIATSSGEVEVYADLKFERVA